MAPRLRVIALISGGKDSLFTILHCLANGHQVVALANLHPATTSPAHGDDGSDGASIANHQNDNPGKTEDDIDSYMYQTVGHSVIPLYAAALELPLYRQPIAGGAVNTHKSYAPPPTSASSGTTDVDETESLVPLLQRALAAHPSANAVSAGAILSDYQRTRVESVALRLGLTPLAFLWQYPSLPPAVPTALLDDMRAVGLRAHIVKVASGGLDERVLWADVTALETQARLRRVMGRFGGVASSGGGALLGEGGEFETLAVDGPAPVWKRRIVLPDEGREVVCGEGGQALIRIGGAKLEEKVEEEMVDRDWLEKLRIPPLLDEEFEKLQESGSWRDVGLIYDQGGRGQNEARPTSIRNTWLRTTTRTTIFLSNMTAPGAGETAQAHMAGIATRLRDLLQGDGLSPDDIVFTTILLRSMGDFVGVNGIYGSLFKKPNPPARATVGCGDALPANVPVMLSVVIDKGRRGSRRALHVQSRSYWAPANIGPYSQAIAVPLPPKNGGSEGKGALVYIAGQIPLIPASMELPERPSETTKAAVLKAFASQATLALQHLWRIGRCMDVNWFVGGVAFIAGRDDIAQKSAIAGRMWSEITSRRSQSEGEDAEENEDRVDEWDRKYGTAKGSAMVEGESRKALPDFSTTTSASGQPTCPFFAVQLEELPRGSDIEWAANGISEASVELWSQELSTDGQATMISQCHPVSTAEVMTFMTISGGSNDDLAGRIGPLLEQLRKKSLHDLLSQHDGADFDSQMTVYTAQDLSGSVEIPLTVVPCHGVWDWEGRKLAAGIVIRSELRRSG